MARILVAEHNRTTSAYLHAALKKAGNTVDVVDNCLDAWRVSSDDRYDILLVDVVMPGIDGFILAQKALQENPELQIIFVTGFAGVAMDTYATPAYAPAPITTRPFHLKDIVSRVRPISRNRAAAPTTLFMPISRITTAPHSKRKKHLFTKGKRICRFAKPLKKWLKPSRTPWHSPKGSMRSRSRSPFA